MILVSIWFFHSRNLCRSQTHEGDWGKIRGVVCFPWEGNGWGEKEQRYGEKTHQGDKKETWFTVNPQEQTKEKSREIILREKMTSPMPGKKRKTGVWSTREVFLKGTKKESQPTTHTLTQKGIQTKENLLFSEQNH